MRNPMKTAIGLVVFLVLAATSLSHASQQGTVEKVFGDANASKSRTGTSREPAYHGKTLSYWLAAIQDRDKEMMPRALDAIRNLGPEAAAAVPELTRIVSSPFAPIELGRDSSELVAAKLYEMEIRSLAVDALAAIGEAASPATVPLIRWALLVRVISPQVRQSDREAFVDLIALETEYRVAVIHAIREFGDPAIALLATFARSASAEERKFAVMILGSDVLPIAAALLTRDNCEDQQLGIALLEDLEPVVAAAYVAQLKHMAVCYAN